MKLDVTELMHDRTSRIAFDYTFDPRHTDVPCVDLPADITVGDNAIHVSGTAEDSFGCMTFRAHVSVRYTALCARCLDEINSSLEFDMERTILTKRLYEEDRHVSEDDEWDGVTDDVLYVNNAHIIPDADILEELSLELPMYELCDENCPGLCPVCGKHLRDGDCGCREKKEINPKLAILQKLLDNQE